MRWMGFYVLCRQDGRISKEIGGMGYREGAMGMRGGLLILFLALIPQQIQHSRVQVIASSPAPPQQPRRPTGWQSALLSVSHRSINTPAARGGNPVARWLRDGLLPAR